MRKTRLSQDEIDLALRLAQEGTPSEEIERRLGLEGSSVDVTPIDSVPERCFGDIAREVFGNDARVASVERLVPISKHGLQRRGGFSGNLVYRVALESEPRDFAFRFNRGFREDVYDDEVESYRRVGAATGIRTPEILAVDRSQRIVPAAYMVLEFLEGEDWRYLSRAENPETTPDQKATIRRETGCFFGRLHDVVRPAEDPEDEARKVLWGLLRLGDVARAGRLAIDSERLGRCRYAVENDPALRTDTQSLCFLDGELYFTQTPAGWQPGFVCDLEWVGFRDRYSDLAAKLSADGELWELDAPLTVDAPTEILHDPFFVGYQTRQAVDVERLARLPIYHQLSLWGHALGDEGDPRKQGWIAENKGSLIQQLVDAVAARAAGL